MRKVEDEQIEEKEEENLALKMEESEESPEKKDEEKPMLPQRRSGRRLRMKGSDRKTKGMRTE